MIFPNCAKILVMTTLSLSKRSGLTWGTPSTIITVSTPSDTLGFFWSTSPSSSTNETVLSRNSISSNTYGWNVSNGGPPNTFFPSALQSTHFPTPNRISATFQTNGGPPIRREPAGRTETQSNSEKKVTPGKATILSRRRI